MNQYIQQVVHINFADSMQKYQYKKRDQALNQLNYRGAEILISFKRFCILLVEMIDLIDI